MSRVQSFRRMMRVIRHDLVRPLTARLLTRVGAWSLVGACCACGAQTSEPDVDGQSHWWRFCADDDDCGDGFHCACGACTRACSTVDSCGETESVQCSLHAGFCKDEYELSEVRVCQVTCQRSSDCPDALTCHSGVCVNPAVAGGSDDVAAPGPGAFEAFDASDVVSACGETGETSCPPPPQDWCTSDGNIPLPEELVAYWSSFCDGGMDASVLITICGDGIIQADEVCDDGNTVSGDGCTATCNSVEQNYDCSLAGEPCAQRN